MRKILIELMVCLYSVLALEISDFVVQYLILLKKKLKKSSFSTFAFSTFHDIGTHL